MNNNHKCDLTAILEKYRWDSLLQAAIHDDLALALLMAYNADAITLSRYRKNDLVINTKPDMSPVSDADVEVEKMIREFIKRYRPSDTVIGEEFGGEVQIDQRQWVIDPIDGTKNFIRNVPIWATLIALLDNGEPVIAVISAPALHSLWWAVKDQGSFALLLDNTIRQLFTSQISKLSDASLGISSLEYWAERKSRIIELSNQLWRVRGYGDFYIFCLLAEGALDIALEPEVNLWDLAAPCLLVQEAGGIFTDFSGIPGPHGGQALASNTALYTQILHILKS